MSLTIGSSSLVYSLLTQMHSLDTQSADIMTRIATGKRINKASDDPAGLIALTNLNSELSGVQTAIDGNTRSQSMLDVADGALSEISSLMSEIQSLVRKGSDTTLSSSERATYQAQIDDSIDAVDRLVNSTTFNGKALFGGDNRIGVTTNSTASVKDLIVYRRNPNNTGNQQLTVNVTAAAKTASAVTTFGATAATTLSAATTIQITGKLGTATISLSQGMNGAQIMAAVQAQKTVTGVDAAAQGTSIAFKSTTTGSDAFVSVQALDGSKAFMNTGTVNKTSGTDAVVKVNNEAATAQGTEVFYTGAGVSLSFNLAKNATNANLTITVAASGGSTFQLGTTSSTQVTMGLGGVTSYELGRSDIGHLSDLRSGGSQALSVSGNNALQIAKDASAQVSQAAARVGAFSKYQLGSSINVLQKSQEALNTSIDAIDSADYATETATLQRQNVLQSALISMLSMANSSQANVLSLLR